ncbi:odorant receptor 131-2-like [Gastrophryne carolinensis]
MANNTSIPANGTDTSMEKTIVVMTSFIILVIAHSLFFYFVGIILWVFFSNSSIKEISRYVLFIHMILNDTLHLLVALFLFISTAYSFYIPVPLCYIILTLSISSFRISPYSLAAMSMERYIAVCYPLRHAQLCTIKMTTTTIAALWAVSLIYNIADLITLCSFVDKKFFSLNVICGRKSLTRTQEQGTISLCEIIISFSSVGLIILYTYVRVAWVARKISSTKSSAIKAGKTIMLHMFQLILYMMSFTSGLTETYLKDNKVFLNIINYLVFMCLPRFLSPLIYGLKDEVFRKYMSKLFTIGTKRYK